MIRSMTGFGEASRHIDGVHYFVEVRSLNNKYFKATIRMPEEFQGLEAEMESELRKRLSRGTVTLRASCTDSSESAAHTINHQALQNYIDQLAKTESIKNGDLTVDVGTLLALPGVLQQPANEDGKLRAARVAFRDLLNESCDHLVSMREREGLMLKEDLLDQQKLIAERLSKLRERAPKSSVEYEQRLRARIDALMSDTGFTAEPAELMREVAIAAEKTDIAEELTRLAAHIDQFSELLSLTEDRPIGRTLDFLSQEMLREANTIASKSQDSEISKLTVEIKGAIDRIKEQVQNVE